MKRNTVLFACVASLYIASAGIPLSAQEPIVLGATSSNLKILYDALAPAYREAGFEPEWRELPGARLMAEIQTGHLDVLLVGSGSMAKQFSDRYIPLGFGSGALGYSRVYMYLCTGDTEKFLPDPKTWAGLSIGEIVDVGPSATFGFPKNVEGVTIVTAPTYETLVRMLSSRRFDFIVSTQGSIEQELRDTGLSDKIVRGSEPLLTVDYWHLVNGRYAERLPALKKAIEARKPQIEAAIERLLNR